MFENIIMWIFKIGFALILCGLVIVAICGVVAIALELFS